MLLSYSFFYSYLKWIIYSWIFYLSLRSLNAYEACLYSYYFSLLAYSVLNFYISYIFD